MKNLIQRIGGGMGTFRGLLPALVIACAAGSYEARAQGRGSVIATPTMKGPKGDTGIGMIMKYDENGKPRFGIYSPAGVLMADDDKPSSQQQTPQQTPQQNYTREQPSNERRSISKPILWDDKDKNGMVWDNKGNIQVIELDDGQPEAYTKRKVIAFVKNLAGEEITVIARQEGREPQEFKQKVKEGQNDSYVILNTNFGDRPIKIEFWCPNVFGTSYAQRTYYPKTPKKE